VILALRNATYGQLDYLYAKGNGKYITVQDVEALKGCERLRLPHFQTFGSQMAARLSALFASRFLPPGRFLVLISVRS
jgi:hypothetical protein